MITLVRTLLSTEVTRNPSTQNCDFLRAEEPYTLCLHSRNGNHAATKASPIAGLQNT